MQMRIGWRAFRWVKRIFCAARWEEKEEEMAAQRASFGRLREEQDSGEEPSAFQFDGRVCGIRLQQVALVRVCVARVSDGYMKAHIRWIHGGATDFRNRERGQQVKYINEARGWHFDFAPDVNESDLYLRRWRIHPVWAGGDQNVGENTAKAIRDHGCTRAVQIALRFLRAD